MFCYKRFNLELVYRLHEIINARSFQIRENKGRYGDEKRLDIQSEHRYWRKAFSNSSAGAGRE